MAKRNNGAKAEGNVESGQPLDQDPLIDATDLRLGNATLVNFNGDGKPDVRTEAAGEGGVEASLKLASTPPSPARLSTGARAFLARSFAASHWACVFFTLEKLIGWRPLLLKLHVPAPGAPGVGTPSFVPPMMTSSSTPKPSVYSEASPLMVKAVFVLGLR